MRSPRDIIPEDELIQMFGGSEAYPDPYSSGSFRGINSFIDPGMQGSNRTRTMNELTGIGNKQSAPNTGAIGDAYLDYYKAGPWTKGPNPWELSPKELVKYAGSDEGIQNAIDMMPDTEALGVKLFKNPFVTIKAQEALEPLAGKLATNRWINRAEDVPNEYQSSPGLGMLKELYEALGIKNKPEMQGSFGAEIEGVSSIPRSDIKKIWPVENWKVGTDISVKGTPSYPNTYEIRNLEPFKGLEGAKQFLLDTRALRRKDQVKDPIFSSGDIYNAGGHLNYSREGMTGQDAQKYVEDFVKTWEPTIYPAANAYSKRDLDRYAQPLVKYLYDNPKALYESAEGKPFNQWGKYTAINLNHLDPGKPTSRIEERFWPGSVDPDEWLKRFILAETRMNSAVNNPQLGGWAGSGRILRDDIKEMATKPAYRVVRPGKQEGMIPEKDVYLKSLDRIANEQERPAMRVDTSFLDEFDITPEQLISIENAIGPRTTPEVTSRRTEYPGNQQIPYTGGDHIPQAPRRSANPWDEPERRSIPGWESFGDLEPDIYHMVRDDVRGLGRTIMGDNEFVLYPHFITGSGLSETGERQADMLRNLFADDSQVIDQLPTMYGRIANIRGDNPATLNRQMLSENAAALNRDYGVDIHPDDLWLARAAIAEYIRNHPGLAQQRQFLVD